MQMLRSHTLKCWHCRSCTTSIASGWSGAIWQSSSETSTATKTKVQIYFDVFRSYTQETINETAFLKTDTFQIKKIF